MIKAFLKKMIPPFFLKKSFLIYNAIKIKTVDSFFFPVLKISAGQFQINREENPFLTLNTPFEHYSKEIREKLKIWIDPSWTQDEYLINFRQHGFIEPLTGWAMTKERRLIKPSLGFANASYVSKPGIIDTYFRKRKLVKFEKVISLRDTGEENYFHFFNDIIPKLFFVQDNGFDLKDFVVIVSEKLSCKEYFRKVVDNSWLRKLQWYYQKQNEWIEFDSVIFCKPLTHKKKYLEQAFRMLGEPQLDKIERRIFLSRDIRSLRFVENLAELEPLLKKHNFEIVDSGKLSLTEQANLFSSCCFLIGIHGAGLVNMVFRKEKPLTVLEIVHPNAYIPFHYIMLSNLFGYKYDVIMGEKGTSHLQGGFKIDVKDIELKLENLLS